MRNALLSTGDGRKLLAAQLCDATAAGVGVVALPWIVLDGGGSSAIAGLVFAAANLPYVIFGLPAGVVGDRRSRKRVMALSHALQMVAAATGADLGGLRARADRARDRLGLLHRHRADVRRRGGLRCRSPSSSAAEDFVHGQAALSTAWGLGFIIGPFVGGVLIAQIGAVEAVAAEAVALGAGRRCSCSRSAGRSAAPEGAGDQPMREAIREGIDVIRNAPVLRLLTLVGAAWNLSIIGAEALIVPLLRNDIGLPANEVGWLLGAAACTAAIAGPLVSMLTRRFGSLRLISAGALPEQRCAASASPSATRSGRRCRPTSRSRSRSGSRSPRSSASASATPPTTCRPASASPGA